MFQSFEDRADRAATPGRVAALRALLREENLTGFIVPHADANQSEYLPPSEERLAWLTGFTGSAGTAIVLLDEAAIFVDGRYTLQAASQVDAGTFAVVPSNETPPAKWLARVKAGDRIGYDPWHLTLAQLRRIERAAAEAGATLVAIDRNPIDQLWTDRPPPPLGAVELHAIERAGEAAADKLARVGAAIAAKKADAAVLGEADAVAWTFNIRGRDVAHNPVPLAFALLRPDDRPVLYVDGRKLSNAVRDALADIADIAEPARLADDLATMGRAGLKVLIDPETTAAAIAAAVVDGGGTLVEGPDPTALLKARKNTAELDGTRAAHRRDGVAMVRFLAWLDRLAPTGTVDEIGAVEALEGFRADTARRDGSELVDVSFDTISGAGPNGAVVHYRVTRATNRTLEPGTLFLIDSGGQYRDGTTDITRTVTVGEPDDEMRDRFTRVLKGHIAIARALFPVGTTGAQLDTLARVALWDAGLDYDHGTGHGVGSFLSVHEGPARISKTGTVPLEPGMILSNEPGYYRTGAYGIRIENLVAVREPTTLEGSDRPMLSFETLTLCPIDRRLVAVPLLTPEERGWLDAYHVRVRTELAPHLEPEDHAWLEQATAPVS
ncbi:MAG: aminopeptidase P family protein [Bauldia sp.]|nr:aminopeptidase P family protein [Bauldia sp.]